MKLPLPMPRLSSLLLCLLSGASAYECDPGRTNTSARAPCAGWTSAKAAAANTTVCEVELGCCWERDDSAAAAVGGGGGIACWAPLVRAAAFTTPQKLTYGKYYGRANSDINAYYLYSPAAATTSGNSSNSSTHRPLLPAIIQIHGGGFTGGSASSSSNAAIEAAVGNGIAYISVNYRLVATKYYYKEAAHTTEGHGEGGHGEGRGERLGGMVEKEEELIHVDADGRLALDTTGKVIGDYQIRRGRQEYNTKCSYDAVQMIEHLIANAADLGIDVHRLSFTGSSAGGGEIHYLTWVYHQWRGAAYTPVGMVYTMAQLDYPVQNMMDRTWGLWADDVGNGTALSTVLAFNDCGMILGNPWCDKGVKVRRRDTGDTVI